MSPEQPPKSSAEQTEEELLAAFAASEERTRRAQEDMQRAMEAAERLSGGSGETETTPPPPDAYSTGVPPPPMPMPPGFPMPPPPMQNTPPAPPTTPQETIPRTSEEIDNDMARTEYFQQMNAKYPKMGTLENDEYRAELERKEKFYKATKRKVVERFLARGEKEKAQEFLLKEVELTRERKIKNHLVTNGERLVVGVSKGIEKWDNWGKAEGMKGYLQRLAKTGVSLAMIGAVSGLSVEGLAKMGIGTASALGTGLTSYLGRKVALGTGISTIMAGVSEKNKKWVSGTLLAGSIGLALAGGGFFAGGAIVASSAVGLTLARLTKKYDKKIAENMKKVKEGKIDLATLEEDVGNMEKEIEEALKQAEKSRVWGKIREGAVAIAGSMATLEVMGITHDVQHTNQEAKRSEAELKINLKIPKPPGLPSDYEKISQTPPHNIPEQNESGLNLNETTPTHLHESSITFDHGKGAIQGILDLKHQLNEQYHGDFSNAPKSVQDFMQTDATKEAIKLGLFDPSAAEGKESALIGEGSVLGLDDHGNITLHDTLTGNDNVLVHGDTAQIEHYGGKMFHSGHPVDAEKPAEIQTPKPETPASPAAVPPAETPKATPEPIVKPDNHATDIVTARENVEHGFGDKGLPKNDSAPASTPAPAPNPQGPLIGRGMNSGGLGETKTVGLPNNAQGQGPLVGLGMNAGGPGGTMGPHFHYFFLGLSPEQNDFLNHHLDFVGKNPFNLTGEKLLETFRAHQHNLDHIFQHDDHGPETWKDMKDLRATELLKNSNSENLLGVYLHKLMDLTHLKPNDSLLGHKETVEEYTARAEQFMTKQGRLIELKEINIE
jgi:hypothetical protein